MFYSKYIHQSDYTDDHTVKMSSFLTEEKNQLKLVPFAMNYDYDVPDKQSNHIL